jgi:hypothetical protein
MAWGRKGEIHFLLALLPVPWFKARIWAGLSSMKRTIMAVEIPPT